MNQSPSELLVQKYISATVTVCQAFFKPVNVDGNLLLQKEMRPNKDWPWGSDPDVWCLVTYSAAPLDIVLDIYQAAFC